MASQTTIATVMEVIIPGLMLPVGAEESLLLHSIRAVNSSSGSGWGTNVICKGKRINGTSVCLRIAHMLNDSLRVRVGQTLLAGELIGLEGTTGSSTGVHAHIQLVDCSSGYPYHIDTGYAGSIGFDQFRRFYNPLQFIPELKQQF